MFHFPGQEITSIDAAIF